MKPLKPQSNYEYEEYTQLFQGSVSLLPMDKSVLLDHNEDPIAIVPKNNPIGFIWNK